MNKEQRIKRIRVLWSINHSQTSSRQTSKRFSSCYNWRQQLWAHHCKISSCVGQGDCHQQSKELEQSNDQRNNYSLKQKVWILQMPHKINVLVVKHDKENSAFGWERDTSEWRAGEGKSVKWHYCKKEEGTVVSPSSFPSLRSTAALHYYLLLWYSWNTHTKLGSTD